MQRRTIGGAGAGDETRKMHKQSQEKEGERIDGTVRAKVWVTRELVPLWNFI